VIHDHEFLGLQSTDAFVGRDSEMEWLDKTLRVSMDGEHAHRDGNSRPVVAALTGLGGSGKTQVMLRYAETHLDDYSAIFWINAKSECTIRSSFNHIARRLHIGSATRIHLGEGQQSSALIRTVETDDVSAFKIWIRTRRRPWLLLFDNLTDILLINSVTQFIPTCSLASGRVLITSRRRLARRDWRLRELAGLNNATAARDLLFYHLGRKQPLSTAEIAQADRIVEELGLFPLSICLAGNYINVIGSMGQYLIYYDKMKRKLLKKTLQGSALEAHYPASVFIAWKTTLEVIPEAAQRLYYLFCAMDRTSISLDLLRRACSSKHRWGPDGELSVVAPADAGVPSWLLAMCLTASGEWDELTVLENIYQLESMFFVRRESLEGDWTYHGRVVKRFEPGRDAILIVKMEHYVQEIGGLMLEDEIMTEYAAAAICTAIHAVEDDVVKSMRLKENESSFDDCFVVLTPTGGMLNNLYRLLFTLEECFGHVRSACECYPGLLSAVEATGLTHAVIFFKDSLYSASASCFFFLSGIYLGGRNPAAACATGAQLLSAIVFASMTLENSRVGDQDDEESLVFWAMVAKVCRVTELILWTRKCWVDGDFLSIRSQNDYAVKRAGEADFFPSLALTAAAIVEYNIADGQFRSPFTFRGGHADPAVSTSKYLDMYWRLLRARAAAVFGCCPSALSSRLNVSTQAEHFRGCTWLLGISKDVPFRDGVRTVPLITPKGIVTMYPTIPMPFDEFLDKFQETTMFQHVWLGMAIVTGHWAKKPLTEFLPWADTSQLPSRKRLE
jgi:hypothetical protein